MSDETTVPAGTETNTGTGEATETTSGSILVESTQQATTPPEGDGTGTQTETKADAPATLPEKYEFTLPEGVVLDEEAMKEFDPIARELGMDNSKAQKVVDIYTKLKQAEATKHAADWSNTLKGWREQISNDEEIGGTTMPANIKAAQSVVARFGNDALRQYLNESGMGDHPEIVRLFVKVGKAMAPDTIHTGSGTETPSAERLLYPTMFKNS